MTIWPATTDQIIRLAKFLTSWIIGWSIHCSSCMNHWCIWVLCELKAPSPPVLCLLQPFLLLHKGYCSKRKAFNSHGMHCNSLKEINYAPATSLPLIWMKLQTLKLEQRIQCGLLLQISVTLRSNPAYHSKWDQSVTWGRFAVCNFYASVRVCRWCVCFRSEWLSDQMRISRLLCAFPSPRVTTSPSLIRFQPTASSPLFLSLWVTLKDYWWPISDPTSHSVIPFFLSSFHCHPSSISFSTVSFIVH